MKLASIVSRKNAYDAYLTSFSFERLLNQIQTFLDSFLEENPSSFLMQVCKSLFSRSSCYNIVPLKFKLRISKVKQIYDRPLRHFQQTVSCHVDFGLYVLVVLSGVVLFACFFV